MWDDSYHGVPYQQNECDTRFRVKKQFVFLGEKASSPVVSENLSAEGNPIDKEGVSREAVNLIIKSRRTSSNSNYELNWGKWASRCGKLVHFVVT